MKRIFQLMAVAACLALNLGCSATGKRDSFIFTADLPENFFYVATVYYKPAAGQTCTVPPRQNLATEFNRHWRTEYKLDSQIDLYRTINGCEMALHRVSLSIKATYGKDYGDMSSDFGGIAVRNWANDKYKGTFNAQGDGEFFGRCQWWFRTIGKKRYITKILNCLNTDSQGVQFGARPFAAYTLEELAGKTIRLKISLASKEKPGWGDTWVEVPGGWKRCMGKSFTDQPGYCDGNYTDFSTFKMPDGRICTIYPGCTENNETAK